jgi:hypothetical protein
VHHADDEAWHVLEGTVRFSFGSRTVEANAGSTVFVPAGVAHTYQALEGARYLLILTPRLRDLIAELQSNRDVAAQAEIYRRYQSELVQGNGQVSMRCARTGAEAGGADTLEALPGEGRAAPQTPLHAAGGKYLEEDTDV